MDMEFIRYAAVKVNTNIFTGKNHHECFKKLKATDHQQGFLADQYSGSRFVGRKEALEIAVAAGQIIHKHPPMNILLSEDLSEDKRFNN